MSVLPPAPAAKATRTPSGEKLGDVLTPGMVESGRRKPCVGLRMKSCGWPRMKLMNASHWPSADQAGDIAIDLCEVSCCASLPSHRITHSSLLPVRSETNASRDRKGPGLPVNRRSSSLASVCAIVGASCVAACSRREYATSPDPRSHRRTSATSWLPAEASDPSSRNCAPAALYWARVRTGSPATGMTERRSASGSRPITAVESRSRRSAARKAAPAAASVPGRGTKSGAATTTL